MRTIDLATGLIDTWADWKSCITQDQMPEPINVDVSGHSLALTFIAPSHIYIADLHLGNCRLVAGTGRQGYSGDGANALGADLNFPVAAAFDESGSLFIADANNYIIRKVTTDGIISTVVGTGRFGYSGDGGPASAAEIGEISDLCVDDVEGLLFVDTEHCVVRRVELASGLITTLAGNGAPGTPATEDLL